MKHLLPLITALLLTAVGAGAVINRGIEPVAVRASRAFDNSEWASAAALYQLAIDRSPDSAALYPRAIVASEIAGDTAATPQMIERAMARGIGFARLIEGVRSTSFAVGAGQYYASLLERLKTEIPWMARPLDHQLLDYYNMRNDGPQIVKYARIMLAGLPDSPEYLSLLARGQMLSDDMAAAAATWTRILDIDPHQYDTLINLGVYYLDGGHPGQAVTYLRRAADIHPTPYLESLIGKCGPVVMTN